MREKRPFCALPAIWTTRSPKRLRVPCLSVFDGQFAMIFILSARFLCRRTANKPGIVVSVFSNIQRRNEGFGQPLNRLVYLRWRGVWNSRSRAVRRNSQIKTCDTFCEALLLSSAPSHLTSFIYPLSTKIKIIYIYSDPLVEKDACFYCCGHVRIVV